MKEENNFYLIEGKEYKLAYIWKRVIALVVDLLFIGITILFLMSLNIFLFNNNQIITNIAAISWLIILYIIYPLLEHKCGATFGKKIFKIECIDILTGNHPSFFRSMFRVIIRSICITTIFPLILSLFALIFFKERLLKYDFFSGVIIIEGNYVKLKDREKKYYS